MRAAFPAAPARRSLHESSQRQEATANFNEEGAAAVNAVRISTLLAKQK